MQGAALRVGSGGSAAATGGDGSAGSSRAAVAARPHFRLGHWRRLPAAISVMEGAGMLHETVKTWHPAAWLMFTLAFRPLATQCWNSAEKSAAVITACCDPGQAGIPLRASPLTTLAHVGEPREAEGRGEMWASYSQPSRLARLLTQGGGGGVEGGCMVG